MTAAPLLEVRGLSLSFDGLRVLDQVSFEVKQGEVCGVIGPNGAGKSSLLNVISGLYAPEKGQICFEGREVRRARELAARGIARTFQNLALFRGMTVLENVELGNDFRSRASLLEQALHVGRASREARRSRAEAGAILDLLDIGRHRDDVVGRQPYGVQKRVELARALAPRPKLLLLDEPMAGMTFDEKREMCGFVVDANEMLGTTLVLIEHDLGVVMELTDHVVVLDHGRKIADGTPDAVRADGGVIEAYVGRFAA